MKKIFVSILAIFYLATSMGATIHLHYCMGRLVSWGLAEHDGKNCDFCGMRKIKTSGDHCTVGMKDCCREESRQFRNDKDQKSGPECIHLSKTSSPSAFTRQPMWCQAIGGFPDLSCPAAHGPPLPASMHVFLLYCNFRI